MRCRQCGTPLLEKARFCTNCGLPAAESQSGKASPDADSVAPEPDEQSSMSDATAQDDPISKTLVVKKRPTHPGETQAADQASHHKRKKKQKKQEQEETSWDSLITGPIYEPSWPTFQADSDADFHTRLNDDSLNTQENRPIESDDTSPPVTPLSPQTPPSSLSYFRLNLNNSAKVTYMPAVVQQSQFTPRRRSGRGWILGCLLTLIIVLAVLIGAWFLIGRPYLHNMAESKINQALGGAINQLPQEQIPPGVPLPTKSIPLSETFINNLITVNSSPSSPVQNTKVSISPQSFTLTFQTYGFNNSISQVPAAKNGQLVATNVNISGPVSLIMTPDEMTSILNRNFANAQQRIQRPITGVQLKDHEMDLIIQ
jgi:hypothetical protein